MRTHLGPSISVRVVAVCLCGIVGVWVPAEQLRAADAAGLEFFEKRVRPILVERCYECHSSQLEEPKGGLRLDSRAGLLAGGDTGPALVPGDPKGSLLIDAINYGDLYQMPPKSKLPPEEIAALTEWVALGAPWPSEPAAGDMAKSQTLDLAARRASHWCWQPVRPPELPQVEQRDWPQQPLDYFILHRLEQQSLPPAPLADRRTLLRRAYFDLIGLPPTVAEVEAFLQDASPQAFERVVDTLLESPRFGERWARHWMDLVRYAETYGHEFDYPIPHAYKYRDYLIRAFNADVPYAQLVLEHVAGDLLDPPRRHPDTGVNESVLATAFWWFGEATHAPVDVRGDSAARVDNQLDVFGKTFLALTIGCARCHDHKFDAISTQDYYALAGFLKSSRRDEPLLDPHGKVAEAAAQLEARYAEANARWESARAAQALDGETFARYLLAAQKLLAARQAVGDDGASLAASIAAREQLDGDQLRSWVAALSQSDVQQPSHPLYVWWRLSSDSSPETFARLKQQAQEDAGQAEQFNAAYPVLADFTSLDGWFVSGAAFTRDLAPSSKWDAQRGGWHAVRPGVASSVRRSPKLQGVLRSPTFTLTHPELCYRIRGRNARVRLVIDGYFMNEYSPLLFQGFAFDVNTGDAFAWHQQAQDVGRYVGHRGYFEILDLGDGFIELDEIRFSPGGPPPERLSPLAAHLLGESVDSLDRLAAAYGALWQRLQASEPEAWRNPHFIELWNWAAQAELLRGADDPLRELERLHQAMGELAVPLPERVLGLTDGTGENAHVYIRGNHRTPGPEVPRRLLEALGGADDVPPNGSGRLELAHRLIDPSNPLTARVMVNRLWHHVMGRGLVATTDNFGVLGEPPTHPELLDLLAHQFIQEGWSVKRLLKSLLMSSTYQMSSQPGTDAAQRDPQNLLWHSARVRRLEGEVIRDAMLALSGSLDPKQFGPSVPVHITPFMQGRGRPKDSGPLDGDGRRSVYVEVRRNFLPPMMLAFDTPIPFNSVGRRNVSNVPAQALILMNDPFVVDQARRWARRVMHETADPHERIRRLYLAAYSRPPTADEQADALAFLQAQSQEYQRPGAEAGSSPPADGDAAAGWLDDEHAWADLCHVLMNVKEFVFLN